MENKLLQKLIHEITKSAYENVNGWMSNDVSIASQLRDGIRTAVNGFDKIESNTIDKSILLNLMQIELDKVFEFYRNLPGDDGTWECSALNIIQRDLSDKIDRMLIPLKRL